METTVPVSLDFKLFIFPDCSEDLNALVDANIGTVNSEVSISQIPGD